MSILECMTYSSSIKKRKKALLFIVLGLCCFAFMAGWVHYRVKRIEAKQKRGFQKLANNSSFFLERLGGLPIPVQLRGIPFGEQLGIVREVINIGIRNVTAPYNPAIIKTPDGYDLFFRYDIFNPKLRYALFNSQIGVVSLDSRFQQKEKEFKQIDLQTNYSEDPRIISIQDQLYLFYNRLEEKTPCCRFMCVANLTPDTYEINYNTLLDMNLQWVEKNWSPFEYVGPDQKSCLLLEYQINPRKLIELPNPQVNEITNIPIPASFAYLNLVWEKKWGKIKGGTPSLLIGDDYLGFFHSWFIDDCKRSWYVIGAYTFAAKPPFQLTRISGYPLLFKNIYETPPINTASLDKRVIFPSGFILEKNKDQELISLVCGENDAGVKVIIIDKENLINNLVHLQ
ncbi:MAG: hypothetical protein ACD_17C00541G0001 [uncultured bacterium]|nr:MAG: hypothetical protein ACD_17C00541G0001 [uncultured bacterium]OGN56347.1 MAG: hypothetical protein A2796_02875 [Chlamydiae bacterium RIFCSPHIGHO2_01_FULL_44_39]OGN59073.1 MAG: hypothetical protein A3C42_01255 [Chlamydiae bacterium RIFCSPHIGHO2_02_FULL_45_9]OGN60261.1 MAG: hypothetical protein A3D96_05465 [Chlamydiae bacterium RIFCSPHIGHO2_12_FULL_44_59]OGN67086.1 MAG: hypothetical protein A2978_00580 [Chlamydiae bacterium RIFCSPLOWO2_01_FULL_44_52]OGN67676.1 MAG: hypothetical protein A3